MPTKILISIWDVRDIDGGMWNEKLKNMSSDLGTLVKVRGYPIQIASIPFSVHKWLASIVFLNKFKK